MIETLAPVVERLAGRGFKRVAYLGAREEWEGVWGGGVQAAARRLGVAVFHAGATLSDYASAMAQIRKEKPDAFFVSPSATAYGRVHDRAGFRSTQDLRSSTH